MDREWFDCAHHPAHSLTGTAHRRGFALVAGPVRRGGAGRSAQPHASCCPPNVRGSIVKKLWVERGLRTRFLLCSSSHPFRPARHSPEQKSGAPGASGGPRFVGDDSPCNSVSAATSLGQLFRPGKVERVGIGPKKTPPHSGPARQIFRHAKLPPPNFCRVGNFSRQENIYRSPLGRIFCVFQRERVAGRNIFKKKNPTCRQ